MRRYTGRRLTHCNGAPVRSVAQSAGSAVGPKLRAAEVLKAGSVGMVERWARHHLDRAAQDLGVGGPGMKKLPLARAVFAAAEEESWRSGGPRAGRSP